MPPATFAPPVDELLPLLLQAAATRAIAAAPQPAIIVMRARPPRARAPAAGGCLVTGLRAAGEPEPSCPLLGGMFSHAASSF